jgi:ribosomal-protein-alanine N-acetyltransferase
MIKEDIPHVLEIERLSYSNPWQSSTFEGEVDNFPISNPYVIVFKPEKRVIGYIIYWRVREEVQISNIAIHPDYRRLGIAEAVMKKILKHLQAEDMKFVILEVRPSNLSAQELYRKLGFIPLGLQKKYYKNPEEDALLMGKTL